jgi:hypothetical protein
MDDSPLWNLWTKIVEQLTVSRQRLQFILILFSSISVGQNTFPVKLDQLRQSIVFLYGSDATGNVNPSTPLATGFFVAVPTKSDPSQSLGLLVTARHVVDPAWATCSQSSNPTRIFMRLNKKTFDPTTNQSGVDYLPLELVREGQTRTVFLNPDSSVDAAVVRLTPALQAQLNQTDMSSIGLPDFATTDELNQLDAGVEVVSAGLLPAFPGTQRNYPVFKFGRISTKPVEQYQMPCGQGRFMPLRVWFVAANLIGGNSGSPIVTVPRLFSADRAEVVGLQSIAFDGTDVAGMTSSDHIFEIIEKMGLSDVDLYRGPPKKK